MKDSSWRPMFALLLIVWGLLLAVNFISPSEISKAITCIPNVLAVLLHAKLNRIPWLGLVLLPPVFAALWGWGRTLMPWFGIVASGLILPIVIGMAAFTPLIYGLGLSGLCYSPISLLAWIAGIGLALAKIGWRPPRLTVGRVADRSSLHWSLDTLTFLSLSLALVETFLPEWFPDAMFYHFALPDQYMQAHRIFADPFVYSSANPQGYACMVVSLFPIEGWRGLKVFQWGVMVLATGAAGTLAREIWEGRAAAAAARALFASLPLVGQLAGHGQTDIPVALAVCAAATALMKWRKGMGAGWLAMGAAAMGAGINCKFTAPLYWAALAFALPGGKMPLRRSFAVWLLGSCATMVPWFFRNIYAFYNPIAPLFPGIIPTFGWNEVAHTAQDTVISSLGFSDGPVSGTASLWLWSGTERGPAEWNMHYGRGGLGILLLAGVFLAILPGLPSWAGWLKWVMLLAPVGWACIIQSYKYLIPFAGLASAFMAGGGGLPLRGGILKCSLTGLVLFQSASLWTRIFMLDPTPWYAGSVPMDTPVARSLEEREILRWIRSLPASSRVLVFWTPALFPSGHRIICSSGDVEAPMLKWLSMAGDPGDLRRSFLQTGITHIAINTGGGMASGGGIWEGSWKPGDRLRQIEVLGGFFRRYAHPVASRGEAMLYEVGGKGGAVLPEPFTGGRQDKNMGPMLIAAGEAIRAGRLADAGAILRAAAPMAGESPYAAFRLGESWTALGEYGTALPLLRKAIAAGYEVGVAYSAMALCLEKLGRPAEARKAGKRAMELDPTDPEGAFRVSLMNEGFCQPR